MVHRLRALLRPITLRRIRDARKTRLSTPAVQLPPAVVRKANVARLARERRPQAAGRGRMVYSTHKAQALRREVRKQAVVRGLVDKTSGTIRIAPILANMRMRRSRQEICHRRRQRREMVFAMGRNRSGAGLKLYTPDSKVRC